jgi:putative spermidine/putrescine transport system ATP-binding protein
MNAKEQLTVNSEPPSIAAEPAAPVPATVVKPALELRQIVKRYGDVEAVRGVDLTVATGEFLTVLGPSGSGKTTALRLIAGFTDITSGHIFLAGNDVSYLTPAQRGIGMVFQNYALFPHMTAADNVAYGLKMRGWGRAERTRRVDEMLDLVGLHGMRERLPRQLSGGQQQRVALARALAFGPTLLLMDEPLGALDRELRIRMAGELRRIHSELNTTVVYVTHDREEALTLSDRIAIMHNGLMEAIGTPTELFTRPSSRFVASFFGGHNVVAAAVKSTSDGLATVAVLGAVATVPAMADLGGVTEAAVVIPASAITTLGGGDHIGFDATIRDVLYMGESIHMTCVAEGDVGLTAAISASLHPTLSRGDTVTLYLNPERLVAVV